MGLHPHDLITPEAPLNAITPGVGSQHMNLGRQCSVSGSTFSTCTARFSPCLGWAEGHSDRHLPRAGGQRERNGSFLRLHTYLSCWNKAARK